MKTLEELYQYYQTDLLPELTVLENVRKKVVRKVTLLIVILGILAFLLLFFLFILHDPLFMILLFVNVGIGFLMYYLFTKGYVKRFKIGIIGKIVNFIEPNLVYSKDKCIPEPIYMESNIFPRRPDRYGGEDYVSGMVGKTEIAFSEIHSEYKIETRDRKGGRHEYWHTIFKGIFFIADFHKDFAGETLVLPDKAERLFGSVLGSMFQSLNLKRDQLIKLEDPEFEKLFVVYGSDQIKARYILSTSLMKRITDFKKKTGKQIYLSFVGGRVFVAIPYIENIFEPRVFKTLLDFSPIQKYFEDLKLAIGIVDELNLNTRIWSKQ